MATIYTASGKPILCDDDDFEWLNQYHWTISDNGYAVASTGIYKGQRMHRLIMGFPYGLEVCHRNNIRDDNRRSNLFIGTHRENMQSTLAPRIQSYDRVTRKYWLLRGHDLIGIYDTKDELHQAWIEAKHGKTPKQTNTSIPID